MGIKCFLIEPTDVDAANAENRDCDWRRTDTGDIVCRGSTWRPHGVPVGAMWYSEYQGDHFPKGPADYHPHIVPEGRNKPAQPSYMFQSGPHLHVMTPGGEWNIDSRASNCTLPYDYEHRCWVRHGEPPNITVDKNGRTCAAGAGSIQCGTYHGFLRAGELTT